MKTKGLAGALAIMTLLGGGLSIRSPRRRSIYVARNESHGLIPTPSKMPLTEEEEKTLASLSGKAKKRYVKDLKTKYENPNQSELESEPSGNPHCMICAGYPGECSMCIADREDPTRE